jgi:hypothetical protein
MDKMCMMFLVMGAKVVGACDSHVTEPQLSCVIARARKRDRTFDSPRVTSRLGGSGQGESRGLVTQLSQGRGSTATFF